MGQTINEKNAENGDLPTPQEADYIMECMMTHYIMQNEIIKSKLNHVQTATRQRMKEMEKAATEAQTAAKIQDLKKVKTLDGLWDKLIGLLQEIGLSEEDIESIDNTVTATPKTIRKYYDILVEQDRELSNLIYEMESNNFKTAYQKAEKTTKSIQKRPNKMSGLLPTEYEPAAENIVSASGFEIITLPNLRENR